MNRFGSLVGGFAIFREGPKAFIYIWLSQLRKLTLALMLVFLQDYVLWSLIIANY